MTDHGHAAGTYSQRLARELAASRHLCAGIDPSSAMLAEWGLDDSAASAERLGREVVAAAAGVAACVKPQVAFFERFGAAGYAALARVLADARAAGVLTIADVKRGDIGTSFAAYADAWLTPGSPLEADAMTVVAYQGFGSLEGAFELIRQHGKGLFVLAATSNPEAFAVQTAVRGDGRTVAQAVVDDALAFHNPTDDHVNSVGVVLGATLQLRDFAITTDAPPAKPALPVLAPGFGAQGANIADAKSIFGGLAWAMLANESRSILAGGAAGLSDRISARAEAIAQAV
ncbi:MAG: orotidine-5'-phosphate decarboxylase [Leucobacter sp.]|nr:orotidine-5'-phosphate decarboxylase [Leucobacter sp.]